MLRLDHFIFLRLRIGPGIIDIGAKIVGINMATIHAMESYGLLGLGRNALDFGSSNLYRATADEVTAFVKRHNPKAHCDLKAWAERLATGSQPDASGRALNEAFVGELLEVAGMGYDAVDIADGCKTTIVDPYTWLRSGVG
jgi:hypothetical protein